MISHWTGLLAVLAFFGGVPFSPSAAARAQTDVVDCNAGQRIQPAIDQARPGHVIVVSGSCIENVVIPEEAARITLDGQGTTTLDAAPNAPPTLSTITVLGRGITIRGFTITGATNAIAVWRGGAAVIEENTLRGGARAGTGGQGINVAQHSYAQIVGNTIESNTNAGITVIEGSYARIGVIIPTVARGNVIRGNGTDGGVYVSRSSGARIGGNTITDNGGSGVLVDGASHAVVSSNRIDANGANGVTVTQNSSVQFGGDIGILAEPNETAVPNQGVGISCSLNSSADGRLATLTGAAGARGFDSSCTDNLAP